MKVTTNSVSVQLQPGEFRLYTDVALPAPERELMNYVSPLTPELVSVTQVGREVVLQWNDNSNIETGYKIFRKKTSATVFTQIGTTGADLETYSDRILEPVTAYDYYVQAYNAAGFRNSGKLSVTTSNDVITSVESDVLTNVAIYPNPGKDIVKIDIPAGIFTVHAVDANGRVVKELRAGGAEHNEYNLSGLQAGFYFIKISGKGNMKYLRFVKL